MDRWKEFPLFLPPLREQREIERRISEQAQKTVRLTSRIEKQVALLVEHRQALITAAVIGELDLSEAV